MLLLGVGPLALISAATQAGLTHDPKPKPFGVGILAGLSFWPGIILVSIQPS